MNSVLTTMLMLLLFVLAGVYLNKVKKISTDASKILSSLVINLATPCTIISSFLVVDNHSDLQQMGVIFFGVILMCLILLVIGVVFAQLANYQPSTKGLVIFLIMFSNNIFMGFPIIAKVLGPQALKFASIICIPLNAIIFSLGIFLISGQKNEFKFQWRQLINPSLFASVIAFIFYLTNPSLPTFLEQAIVSIGNISVPLAMIIFGITISDIPIKEILQDYRGYSFCLVKLILVPVAVWLVLQPLINDPVIAGVFVITAAMPSGNISIMLSEEYGNDASLASKYVGISTVISMITIPLICLWLV